jgi:hypothetical protein
MKRRIVAETLAPGSIVAPRHDVNANQVFKWWRAMVPKPPAVAKQSIAMLPVEIVPEAGEPRPRARRSGVFNITFRSSVPVCLRGEVSPETLRQVIEPLR